jgi:two-component system sensor histidine kinase HydH
MIKVNNRGNVSQHSAPPSKQPFKISKAALGLVLTAFLLVALLAFSAIKNIHQARTMMENLLVQKGEMIIRSIEAATRTIMHHMDEGNPLETLITENSRENDVIFIRIMSRQGEVLAETGDGKYPHLSAEEIAEIMDDDIRQVQLGKQEGLFSLSRKFQLMQNTRMPMMMQRQWLRNTFHWDEMIISVGLLTTEFDLTRKRDVRHALFMAAILFLVGSAGFYFLFLYQGMRVARATLANMKLYTDNVIKCIPAGLVTLDADDRIVSCNRKAEEISGKSFDTMQGMNLHEALPGCPLNCSQICQDSLEHAAKCETLDGRKIPIKISGSSLLDHNGQNIGTVLIIRDMSLMHEMEQQLERSRRMAALGKMAAGIAHEIRNPLGTLRGFAQYFGKKAGDDRESKGYSDLMVSEVDRLNQNISGLLQFARPREPQFLSVEVDGIITKTVALMEADFKSHSMNFHWECNTNIIVMADPDFILQVLLNLLKNSINATESGGEISLTVRQDNERVIFSVKDNGCGMTERERERMFDPFFTSKKTGTGLGLAVSHQIIEQHRGSFEVHSDPGRGTEISIILPKNSINQEA